MDLFETVQVVGLGALWNISSSAVHTFWVPRLRVVSIGPSWSPHCVRHQMPTCHWKYAEHAKVARFLCLTHRSRSPPTLIVQVCSGTCMLVCQIFATRLEVGRLRHTLWDFLSPFDAAPRITFSGSWPSFTHPLIEKVHAGLVLFFVVHLGQDAARFNCKTMML